MIRFVLPLLAPLLLGLGGCGLLQGAAGALGVQAFSVIGQGTIRAVEADIAATQRWVGRHEAAVAVFEAACLAHAQRLALGDDWAAASAAFEDCLDKSVENMPTLLIERVEMRIARRRAKEAAEPPIEGEGAAAGATEPPIEEEGAGPQIE